MNDLEAARNECDRLRDYCHRLEASALADSIIDGDRLDTAAMIRSMDSSSRTTPAAQLLHSSSSLHLVLTSECQSPACLERTRLLGEENKQLFESVSIYLYYLIFGVFCGMLCFLFKFLFSKAPLLL